MKEVRTDLWEKIRKRLLELQPPIDEDATVLGPILDDIEARLTEYIATAGDTRATRLFVSQLTREHLRKTIAFFLTVCEGETPVPFQDAGTGTLNTLVLALLTFIAEIKKDNIIFAMEEPEIALPPHTQRRIANYLLTQTKQCFVTSHSPYVIECFEPEAIVRLTRDKAGVLTATPVGLPPTMKAKTYRSQLRRAIAEAMLGRGAIVTEGITEHLAITCIAKKMEQSDQTLFPLDLAGITIVNAEGDGNLEAIGSFFQSLDIPAFAIFDRNKRKDDEVAKIIANFTMTHMSSDFCSTHRLRSCMTVSFVEVRLTAYQSAKRFSWTPKCGSNRQVWTFQSVEIRGFGRRKTGLTDPWGCPKRAQSRTGLKRSEKTSGGFSTPLTKMCHTRDSNAILCTALEMSARSLC